MCSKDDKYLATHNGLNTRKKIKVSGTPFTEKVIHTPQGLSRLWFQRSLPRAERTWYKNIRF